MATKLGTAAIMPIYGFVNDTFDNITPVGLQDLGFTLTQLKGADVVLIEIEGDGLRWKADDVDAAGYVPVSSSVGFPETINTKFEVWGYPNMMNLRMIAVSGTCSVTMSLGRFGEAVRDINRTSILPPDTDFSYVPFTIYRFGNTVLVDPSFNLRTYANISVTKTYYLNTVTGNDGNSGLTSLLPKKTWNNIIGMGDYDRIIIQDGSYLIRSESILQPNRNVEVIGEGTVYFTSDRSNNLGAWSLTPAQTFTFQAATGGEFISKVYDESVLDAFGNPTRYTEKTSIATVESTAGSYWWSGGTLYVHALNGLTPSGRTDLKYYDSVAAGWNKDSLKFYIENVNFRGGCLFQNASATANSKFYLKNCTGYSLSVNGVTEFIAQDCTLFTAVGDSANYSILNTVSTKAIEINCEFYDSGITSTDQASTSHNGSPVVRINGRYHDVTGQCVGEANVTTKTWLLGCEMYNSSVANIGYFTQGQAWLDTCNIHNVTTDLQNEAGSTIYTHNLTSGGNNIIGGTLTPY